jgi:hypothetical protein
MYTSAMALEFTRQTDALIMRCSGNSQTMCYLGEDMAPACAITSAGGTFFNFIMRGAGSQTPDFQFPFFYSAGLSGLAVFFTVVTNVEAGLMVRATTTGIPTGAGDTSTVAIVGPSGSTTREIGWTQNLQGPAGAIRYWDVRSGVIGFDDSTTPSEDFFYLTLQAALPQNYSTVVDNSGQLTAYLKAISLFEIPTEGEY